MLLLIVNYFLKSNYVGYGNGDGVTRKGKRRVWNFGAAMLSMLPWTEEGRILL